MENILSYFLLSGSFLDILLTVADTSLAILVLSLELNENRIDRDEVPDVFPVLEVSSAVISIVMFALLRQTQVICGVLSVLA